MKHFLENISRTQLLSFQTFLVDHLPSYVDVSLQEDGVILSGKFEPIEVKLFDIGSGSTTAKIIISTAYGVELTHNAAPSWKPADVKLTDIRPIFMVLNTNVGLYKIISWLTSQGFTRSKNEARYEKDEPQPFTYEKLILQNVKVLVTFKSDLDESSSYVLVGVDDNNHWMNQRHRFSATSLKRVQHAVDEAIDDYRTTGNSHHHLSIDRNKLTHLNVNEVPDQ